ncbi:universal stress protein [Halolamina sp.]|jgi:nucleotide-binding universal stress UspA family protein|uniref:universal stress protein n=1 Tax=Halolamina sp. TaxID=1940283 RepID=UPI000223BA00|nr:UspA domain-containing protein [halophilic archaeon DL31]
MGLLREAVVPLARRLQAGLLAAYRRGRALERRELAEFHRWVENTNNLVHLSVLLFVPLLIAVVTLLSNTVNALPYLLFPPLASGTYMLFAQPESRYASPKRFVGGITLGALCGLVSFEMASLLLPTPAAVAVNPAAAAGAIALTAVVTWGLDLEEASAFSSALLVLVIEVAGVEPVLVQVVSGFVVAINPRAAYVVSVFLSTTLVAGVFVGWRKLFYEQRAAYLYGTTRGDDHVLVPMRGETAERSAMLAARLAADHDAGKVVLLDVLPGEVGAGVQGRLDPSELDSEAAERVREAAERLDAVASRLRTRVGVPCEVVVAAGDAAPTTIDTAKRTNCDLVVTPYEEEQGRLSPYVRAVLASPIDAIAHRSTGEPRWRRVLVPVSRPGDSAHAMMDFATRLAGEWGSVSACTCINREAERRTAESRLANIVEAFDGPIETRVARAAVTEFIEQNAGAYDLVVVGSSGDRSAASRLVSPPTFERLREVDCDVAVVDRGEL